MQLCFRYSLRVRLMLLRCVLSSSGALIGRPKDSPAAYWMSFFVIGGLGASPFGGPPLLSSSTLLIRKWSSWNWVRSHVPWTRRQQASTSPYSSGAPSSGSRRGWNSLAGSRLPS